MFTSLSYCPHPWSLTVIICCTNCLSDYLSASVLLPPSLVTYCHLLHCPHPWLLTVIICWTDCPSASLSAYNVSTCSLHCLTVPILGHLLLSSAAPTVCLIIFLHLSYCPHPWLLTVIICCTNCLSDYLSASVLLPLSLVTYCHHLLHWLSIWLSVCIQCTNMFTSLSYCPYSWLLTVIICCFDCPSASLSAYNVPTCSLYCLTLPMIMHLSLVSI